MTFAIGFTLRNWKPILIGACLAFGLLFFFFFAAGQDEQQIYNGSVGQGVITPLGEKEIPAEYIPIYQAAAKKYNVKWELLSAIHRVETHFGADLNVSSVGALGHTQFMPKTWVNLTVQPLYPVMGIENLSNSVKLLTHKGEDNTERSLKGNV